MPCGASKVVGILLETRGVQNACLFAAHSTWCKRLPSNRCAWWKGSARSSQHACAPLPTLCTPSAMRSATGDGVCGAHSLQPSHPTSHPAARASPPSGTCVWAGVLPRCPITLSPTPSPVPATHPPPLPTLCTPSATCSTLRSTAQTTKSHLLTTSSGAQP
jgi:hypothetical protein